MQTELDSYIRLRYGQPEMTIEYLRRLPFEVLIEIRRHTGADMTAPLSSDLAEAVITGIMLDGWVRFAPGLLCRQAELLLREYHELHGT